ncbi:MAG TPA: hypothetical protein VFD84_09315 [Candidatus Binatia bacterium]|nr:hypothetical protein [Candidatus Binatia bacterium]
MKARDPLPLSHDAIRSTACVAACVVAPETTPLLALARDQGRRIQTGVPMLAAQLDPRLAFMRVPV